MYGTGGLSLTDEGRRPSPACCPHEGQALEVVHLLRKMRYQAPKLKKEPRNHGQMLRRYCAERWQILRRYCAERWRSHLRRRAADGAALLAALRLGRDTAARQETAPRHVHF